MTTIFHDVIHQEMEDYIEDIVVKSKSMEGHFKVLERVFERCRMYKLLMNPLKCAFGVSIGEVPWFSGTSLLGNLVWHLIAHEQKRRKESFKPSVWNMLNE